MLIEPISILLIIF